MPLSGPAEKVTGAPGLAPADVLRRGFKAAAPTFLTVIFFSMFINVLMLVGPLYIAYAFLEMFRSRVLVRAGILFDEHLANPVFDAVHRARLRRCCVTSMCYGRELFRVKMRETFYASVEALQDNLDAWLVHYNTERPHLGYRNMGRRPWETDNKFVGQEA